MQPEDGQHVVADSPPPPSTAALWRHRLYAALHTRRAHVVFLVIIITDVLVNVTGLLLALFTCRTEHHKLAESARTAEEALRWASVALLGVMLLELIARAVAVGPVRFFAAPLHTLDAAVLAGLLAVEAAVSDRAAEEALGLLVIVRVGRVLRLLSSMQELSSEHHAALKAHLAAQDLRVAELEAALRDVEAPPDGPTPHRHRLG